MTPKNKIALVTGVTGQDGAYLAELWRLQPCVPKGASTVLRGWARATVPSYPTLRVTRTTNCFAAWAARHSPRGGAPLA